jgi:RND family efflux transporter MFP subunit
MSTVTVSFRVPERASGLVAVGQDVTGTTDALAGQTFAGKVTAVDSRVDATSRTLGVEASLPNSGSALKPGMALKLTMKFPGKPNPAVSSLSIQWDRQGSYVWKVDGDVVHRIAVQIVTRRSGIVTVAAKLNAGDLVVTDGVLRLREGTAVAMSGPPVGASAEASGPAAAAPVSGEAAKTGRPKPPPADQPKT